MISLIWLLILLLSCNLELFLFTWWVLHASRSLYLFFYWLLFYISLLLWRASVLIPFPHMNLHLFIYWLNNNIFLHVMFRIELILSCCKNNIKLGLVLIQSKININFFPLSFFGHFLYVQTPVLFQVFVKISMTLEI